MMNTGLSASDVALLNRNGGNDGMFGGGGCWIWVILIFAIIFGWGGYCGFGGGAGGGQLGNNYALITDNATLERKIDGVYSGICDSTFALNNTINNGFASAQNTMTQGFAGLNTALVTQGYETRNAVTQDTIANLQGFNGIQAAVKDCCCNTQSSLKDVNYNMATQANGITNAINTGFCQTNFNAQQNTRDIVENQNANARAILEAINQNKFEALKDRIAEQNQTINALNLAASQQAQNAYLIGQLRPNLYCNCNNGCGCA